MLKANLAREKIFKHFHVKPSMSSCDAAYLHNSSTTLRFPQIAFNTNVFKIA